MTMSMCVRSAQHGGGACAARCGARVRGDQKATERKSEVSRRALGFVGTCAQKTAAVYGRSGARCVRGAAGSEPACRRRCMLRPAGSLPFD